MKVRFELFEELKKLVDAVEFSGLQVKNNKGQQTIYRTAKGLLQALKEENKRTPALFESKKEISAEMEQFLKFFIDEYQELQRITRQLHRLDENSCNYGLTERQEKRQENLEREAQKIAERLGFKFYHQGDPRGLTGWLLTKDQDASTHLDGIPIY